MSLQQIKILSVPPVSSISFVWRPREITQPVIQMAQRTGSRAIFDFSALGVEEIGAFLATADPGAEVRDLKVSISTFFDPSLGPLLERAGVRNIWVECRPLLSREDTALLLGRLRELSGNHRCYPITGDRNLLAALVKETSGVGRVVLKGCEASGFVSGETTTTLYATLKEMLSVGSKPLEIIIWGGIATPEAAAAFLSTGAAGVVFESLHWMTDLVDIDETQRQRIGKLRRDATELLGVNLQVPCRLFNKGNSLAFKEIKAFENSLYGSPVDEESRGRLVSRVQARAVHPLESAFSQDEVIALGVEASFAASFAERFGTGTEGAVQAFTNEIGRCCDRAEATRDCFLDSPVAREMGTRYPFVQGAMSWITDVPEFASNVADAGGLPTIALGMMDAQTLDRRLGNLPEIMAGRPYALNLISLAENPLREIHLNWIKKQKPKFVVIAGGDLSPAKGLMECGIKVIYIAPDEALLRLALEAGVHYVAFEGYEAGGHVGQLSTLTLAQMVLELKRRTPELFKNTRVILAGGIYNRETAFLAAMLGADAVQMGTAYLTTREILETGTLVPLYQRMILQSAPEGTVVSGQDTGLRVRSLKSPRVEAILSLERAFAAGHHDEATFRKEMEEMAAGSLYAAARGLNRPCGASLDEAACLERGQFMSGACAGLIREARKLQTLHLELAEGPLALQLPVVGELGRLDLLAPVRPLLREIPAPGVGVRQLAPHSAANERIAITGMSIANSLGKSPQEIWAASLALKCGITTVPASRWDHGLYYDARPLTTDKTYCQVAAFLDFPISRAELGIPPQDFRTMSYATKLTLWLAEKAIQDSGILNSDIPPERIGVVISQNSGEAAGTLNSIIIRAYTHDILSAVKRAVQLTPEQASAVEREVKAGRLAPDDTTLLGRLNCAAPGFICNKYGFMGPSYAVSAACASSLTALYSAIQMIKNGIIDAAVVGGGEDNLTHLHFLEFAAVGALYGMSGQDRPAHETSRPFDAERDGMVLGEGGGMIVIERESLARARGARINALITGMGASNNNLGMVESNSLTQEMAIRASFRETPYGPDAVDLVECHATSTRQGDVEEVRALKTFFDPSKRTVLTSFKSQIGHTLGASGISNLIRGTMAMKSEIFPATINYQHPDPAIGLEGSGLLVPTEPLDWKANSAGPRRFQVNAFGFGGSNYVVQVEQDGAEAATLLLSPDRALGLAAPKTSAALANTTAAKLTIPPGLNSPSPLAGEGRGGGEGAIVREGLNLTAVPAIPGVSFFRTEIAGRGCRMAVVAPSEAEALAVVESSASLVQAEMGSAKGIRALAQKGIFLSPAEQTAPPLALVFPGQGAQYAGMGRELYDSFPVIKHWMDRAAAAAEFDLLQLLFHDREENLQKTRWQQPALFAVEHAMARYLTSLGIRPVAMAGHSLGELTALCLAGVFSAEDGFRIVNKRALCMDKASAMHGDPGTMAAVDAPLDLLKELLQGQTQVHIGNINSPQQVVLSGNTEELRNLCKKLKEMGCRATFLRVSMAFHSPIMEVIHDELQEYVASIEFKSPEVPVISNTTMAPYPSDPVEIKRILMAHLESPVQWMENVRTLGTDYGVRHFVEVGPGEALSNLIADTLPESTCIQTCFSSAEGTTYQAALAQLYVQGHLKLPAEPGFISLPGTGKTFEVHPATVAASLVQLPSGVAGVPEVQLPVASAKPAGVHLDGAPAQTGQAAPACSASLQGTVLMGQLIGIIMEATGFEREEIQPAMDLRRDLSIRSSRLPIIMDAAERQFEITIEMEDFLDVRTVEDIAQRISTIMAREGVVVQQTNAQAADPGVKAADPGAQSAQAAAPVVQAAVPDTQAAAPVVQVADPGAAVAVPASPAGSETHEGADLMERLIHIIMDSTGFERDEIQPGMDLRRDLSIRSSRLPIIMDAAEREFGIEIEMEDFIDVRTVADIAQRISMILARQGADSPEPEAKAVVIEAVREETRKPAQGEACLKRIVFDGVAAETAASIPMSLSPGESVILLAPDLNNGIAAGLKEALRQDYGVEAHAMLFLRGGTTPGGECYDLLTNEGAGKAAESLSVVKDLAGMVIALPQGDSDELSSMEDASRLLRGLFLQLKAFLRSPKKKFVVLVHSGEGTGTGSQLLAEGMLGLFLSAAQEYSSVQFRTLEIAGDTDLRAALRGALDKGCGAVELVHRGGKVLTSAGHSAPVLLADASGLKLSPGDVIVMSGGATGISAVLARSLAPFMPRLVFLGRTSLDTGSDPAQSLSVQPPCETPAADRRGGEIARTLADLHSSGIEASYHTCDVTDPEAVRATLGEVVQRYGRIDGVIHGAGVLRDGLLGQMTPEDFSTVTDVKFLGAWNLFKAAQGNGLRFFVGLSSAAAIQGNPGQANYAAANRMMSGLLRTLRRENGAILFKALMLPPIDGAGMAENTELRELLKLKGVGYIHADELAGLFCRELMVAPAEDVWVMFMRTLPTLRTAPVLHTTRPTLAGALNAGTVSLRTENFPMIAEVSVLDLRREELEAERTFSLEQDLWIADHRPFTFIEHPLVSATMVLETFMETARILYPHLQVRGVRQVRFIDMIQCPPGVSRPARISCHRVDNGLGEVACEAVLAAPEITPAGRLTDRFIPHYKGQVLLGGGAEHPFEGFADFPVRPDELPSGPMDGDQVLRWYTERSGLAGRYRVLESLDGAGPGAVRGRTSYRETRDFALPGDTRYQYPVYLFEALLQLAGFYLAATDPTERRSMIPLEVGEMRFSRQCRAGEPIILEARLRVKDGEGITWDARGVDEQGIAIMQVHNMRMQWVSQ